jgi:hypothetical protein
MSAYRFNIEALAGPARRRRLGGAMVLLVRVRLFDGPGIVNAVTSEPASLPDAFTDLDPREARELAFCLLTAAEDAEEQTLEANYWEPRR